MIMSAFDCIVLSVDDYTEKFIHFVPIVVAAYRKFFPSKQIHLALLTDNFDDVKFDYLKSLPVNITPLKPAIGIPIGNQAKVARFFLASTLGTQVCMIDDIDTIPLQTDFIDRITKQREARTILAVGREVFQGTPNEGKFPISNITARSFVFQKFINPENITNFAQFIYSLPISPYIDGKENISNPESNFSDESLVRSHLKHFIPEKNITHVKRDVDQFNDWIDRSYWKIDIEKLFAGKYVICNFKRPFKENSADAVPVIDYIFGEVPQKLFAY